MNKLKKILKVLWDMIKDFMLQIGILIVVLILCGAIVGAVSLPSIICMYVFNTKVGSWVFIITWISILVLMFGCEFVTNFKMKMRKYED